MEIGRAQTCFTEKFPIPRQPGLAPSAWGKIILNKEFAREDALRGLSDFSHITLIFHTHENKSNKNSLSVRPPRLGGNTKLGVFATRSPFRPNGLCISTVKLEKVDIENGEIHFSNHDILNDSPIIDIRPFIPLWDHFPNATNGWIENDISSTPKYHVEFICPIKDQKLMRLIQEVLTLNPGPTYQKGNQEYRFNIDNHEVHYTREHSVIKVLSIN